jgi:hypothetical protein
MSMSDLRELPGCGGAPVPGGRPQRRALRRARWFGVVVGATPRTGELPRGETIPWRVIAAQIAPREHRGSHRPDGAPRDRRQHSSAVLRHDCERWRLSRVQSIFGGTTEIQKEIIGRGPGL